MKTQWLPKSRAVITARCSIYNQGHSSQWGLGMWWQSQPVSQAELLTLSAPPLTIIHHHLASYHQHYSAFQNVNLTLNKLITYWLQFGRPHIWQNTLFQHGAYTILQLIRTSHIGTIFNSYQTEAFTCTTKLWWDLPFWKCFEREGVALKQSGRSHLFFKSSARTKTHELLN